MRWVLAGTALAATVCWGAHQLREFRRQVRDLDTAVSGLGSLVAELSEPAAVPGWKDGGGEVSYQSPGRRR